MLGLYARIVGTKDKVAAVMDNAANYAAPTTVKVTLQVEVSEVINDKGYRTPVMRDIQSWVINEATKWHTFEDIVEVMPANDKAGQFRVLKKCRELSWEPQVYWQDFDGQHYALVVVPA
jgi:hypothetical protein